MKRVIGILAALLIVFSVSAQDKKAQREQKKAEIMEAKKEFFKTEVGLSDKTMEAFWSLYLEMNEERKALKKEFKGPKKEEIKEMTEDEVRVFIQKRFEFERKQIDLKEKYYKKYSEILSQKEILKVQVAEKRFKKELLKKLKEGKKE